MISVGALISNLAGLFLLMGVGFAAARMKLVPMSGFDPMIDLLLKISLPATIFTSMLRPFDAQFLRDGVTVFLLALMSILMCVVLTSVLSRLFRIPKGQRGTWCFCGTFCNCGFVGYPMAYALFGDVGLSLAVFLGTAYNFFCFTLGVMMVRRDAATVSGENMSLRAVLCTPVNLAAALGLICYCIQFPMPEVLTTPLEHLANLTTPLSMFVTGMSLSQGRITEQFQDRAARLIVLIRLLVCPVITLAIVSLLPIESPIVINVTLILVSTPCATTATMLAHQYGGCVPLAVRAVFLSSLLCIVTIPLISLLL